MAHENQDEGLIRRYLLGQLAEDELQRLEEKIMADNEFFDQVLLAEDEMVEEYVQGELSSSDRAGFEASFLCTPEGRQKVAYLTALGKYVQDVSPSPDPEVLIAKEPVGHAVAAEKPLAVGPLVEGAVAEEPPKKKRVPRPAWWNRPALVPYFRLAAAVVVVLGVGLGIWRVFIYQSEVNKGMTALAYAYRDQRPLEARISGFNYAPAVTTRGGEPKIDRTARNLAESVLLEAVLKHPNAATHHAAGMLYLAEKKFDEAIEQFVEAQKADSNNAQLQSDYGAALLEKGKIDVQEDKNGKGFEEFARALEHLNRALDLDGNLLDALFNRALLHQEMMLAQQAQRDWQEYLKKDAQSQWADEARRNLSQLEEKKNSSSQNRDLLQDFMKAYGARDNAQTWKIVTQNRSQIESVIEGKLIDAYLDQATKRHDAETKDRLEALLYAAEVERQYAGDAFVPNLVHFYQHATTHQLEQVVVGRDLVKLGNKELAAPRFDAAIDAYNRAKEAFERADDGCEALCMEYLIGGCYVQQSKAESALPVFEALAVACERSQYKWLLIQTLIAISGADQYSRDFASAIAATTRSLELSERISDPIGVERSRFQLGDIYRFLNNGRRALDHHARGLPLAQAYFAQPSQLWRSYFSLSKVFDQLNLPAAAIDFQKEAVALAVQAKAPRLVCRSENDLGLMLAKGGDVDEGIKSINRAIDIGNSFQERNVQLEVTAYSFLHLGQVYEKTADYQKATEYFDRAIQSYVELDSKFFAFSAQEGRVQCCLESGGCSDAKQQLETMLNLFEDQRAKIVADSDQNSFFDPKQRVYDLAVGFEYYKEGDPRRAFEYSERSRGRSLSALMNMKPATVYAPDRERPSRPANPFDFDRFQGRIPEQSQILQYAVLKNSILIWVVSKDGDLYTVPRAISFEDLKREVSDFLHLLANSDEGDGEVLSREASRLYDLLIKPVEDRIDETKLLCIVPDKILNYLPFGALISQAPDSPDSRRYFVEQHDFVLSPSSTVFIQCSDFAREKAPTENETLCSVGNPAFDRKAFPLLSDLRSAAKEATTIAGFYGSPPPIVGASATKTRVVREMEKSDVIHLATHAITDEWNPRRSKFLLAKDNAGAGGEDSGVLQGAEIYELNLRRVRLVVLSACETGVETYYGGEGMIGLSRPFIANGVPLVVASLWPVDSDATFRLMRSFHRLRKTGVGLPSARALCSAQREMIRSSDAEDRLPRNWAAFVTIGGYAGF